MSKRFTDTEKWTKNKWFRKLPTDYKMLWLFILDNCDCVGVWEEDLEFVSTLLGAEYTSEIALAHFEKQIQLTNGGRKWWITNFCFYQYGELKEENIKNKPHQKYISELKKHRLWIDYTKTIHSLKEKDKEEEQEKDEDKGGLGDFVPDVKLPFIIPDRPPAAIMEAAEMNQWTMTKNKNTQFILEQWQIFTLERVNDPPVQKSNYRQLTDITKYFLNWIRDKKPSNGTHQQNNKSGGKSAGASKLASSLAADLHHLAAGGTQGNRA